MEKEEIKQKLQDYTIRIVNFCNDMPKNKALQIFSKHLINNAGMTGSRFMSAVNAKTPASFIQRARVAEEKGYDCIYYLELIKAIYTENNEAEQLIQEMKSISNEIEASYKAASNKKIGFGAYKEEEDL